MQIRQYNYDSNILLFNLGDVHRGDAGCNERLLRNTISEIHRTKNAYWVSTGDLCNVALKTSKSDCYTSKSLNVERKLLREELSCISDKCLGIIGSNHHKRFDIVTGDSLDEIICTELGIPYLGKLGILNVTCGRTTYYIVLHHGVGMGKKRGSKTNNTEELSNIIPAADLYMEGHTHSFDHFVDEVSYIDRKRGSLVVQQMTFCVTGHFLKWNDSYAADMKLPARPQGAAVVELYGNNTGISRNKKIKVDLFGN